MLHRPARAMAERVRQSAEWAVGTNDEIGAIDRAPRGPVGVGDRRGDRGDHGGLHGDGIAAHEHAAEIGPPPQILQRKRCGIGGVVERHAGCLADARQQLPPRRLGIRRHRVHARIGNRRHRAVAGHRRSHSLRAPSHHMGRPGGSNRPHPKRGTASSRRRVASCAGWRNSVAGGPDSTIRPASMIATRVATALSKARSCDISR